MTPIEFFAVNNPSIKIYNRATDNLVATLTATPRIAGSLVAREIDLSSLPDGEYDMISELPSPGSFALRISSGIAFIAEYWSEVDESNPNETVILTIQDSEGVLVAGADVYLSYDVAGASIAKDGLVSNSLGKVYAYLVPGTYYVWVTHPNRTFNNPTTITVQNA